MPRRDSHRSPRGGRRGKIPPSEIISYYSKKRRMVGSSSIYLINFGKDDEGRMGKDKREKGGGGGR